MFAVYPWLLFASCAIIGINATAVEKRLKNGAGLTPALGWNNWNSGLPPTAENALKTANLFVSLGLKELNYSYINMDLGWSAKERSGGNLVPNSTYFPDGIPAVTKKIHGLGLKFGLFGDAGAKTCGDYPGSQGHEREDAAQFVKWEIDYLKYDNCNFPDGDATKGYTDMYNALKSQNRPILYSLSQWGANSEKTWGPTLANSWRVGKDISDTWRSIATIAAGNAALYSQATPGGFNDWDMLEIGNGGLTPAEERTHFGLWAISKSPLLIGCDLSKISEPSLAILKNKGIIEINQDLLGVAATTFKPPSIEEGPTGDALWPYWSGKLSDGYIVGLVNVNRTSTTLSVSLGDVPGIWPGTYAWEELYSGRKGQSDSVSAKLDGHDMAVFKVHTAM